MVKSRLVYKDNREDSLENEGLACYMQQYKFEIVVQTSAKATMFSQCDYGLHWHDIGPLRIEVRFTVPRTSMLHNNVCSRQVWLKKCG